MDRKGTICGDTFDSIFNRYASGVYYFSLRLTNNPADAEEVVQETFLKVWENRDQIDRDRNLGTYINTIARNQIYDMFRRALVRQKYGQRLKESMDQHVSLEKELHLKELCEVVRTSVGKLAGQQREILILKSKGFLNEEIAELLGLSKRTVESHLNKAYKTLRGDLGNLGDILALVMLIISLM